MVKTGTSPCNEVKKWGPIVRWNAGRFHPKNWSQRSFWPSRAGLLLCLLPLQHAQHSCHCQGHWPSCHFLSHFLQRRVKGAAIPSTQLLRSMLLYQLLRIEWWDLQEVKQVKHLVKACACKSSSLSQALWPNAEFFYHTHSISFILYSKKRDGPSGNKCLQWWNPSKSGPAPAR